MRQVAVTHTYYQFNELSPSAQDHAIEQLTDINVDYDWAEWTIEDANMIGLKITSWDLYRKTIDGTLTKSVRDVIKLIKKNHGKDWDTYKTAETAQQFAREKILQARLEGKDIPDDIHLGECLCRDLLKDYLKLLCDEYNYRTSREAIVETIEANEYEFTEEGDLV